MNHVSEHTTGVGNKRFPACLYYDFKGRTSWKAVLPFLREREAMSRASWNVLAQIPAYTANAHNEQRRERRVYGTD